MGDEISVFDGRTGEWRKPTKEERERILAERAGAPAAEPAAEAEGVCPRQVAEDAILDDFGEAQDGVEGRAQLVTGVGDETPHPVLGLPGLRLRGLLRGEGTLDARDHGVDLHQSRPPSLLSSSCLGPSGPAGCAFTRVTLGGGRGQTN